MKEFCHHSIAKNQYQDEDNRHDQTQIRRWKSGIEGSGNGKTINDGTKHNAGGKANEAGAFK